LGSSPSIINSRPVVRCRSEGDLSPVSRDQSPVERNPQGHQGTRSISRHHGVRRASTLPADAFVPSDTFPPFALSQPPAPLSTLDWATMVAKSTDIPGVGLLSTTSNHDELLQDLNVTPPTPNLSYSPSSTESGSSGGDRTIQMSGFLDASTPPNNCAGGFTSFVDKAAAAVGGFYLGMSGSLPHIAAGETMPVDSPDRCERVGISGGGPLEIVYAY